MPDPNHPSPKDSDSQVDGSEMGIDQLVDSDVPPPENSLPKLRRSHRVKRPPDSLHSKHVNMLINIHF
jgi:hypothetical protein